MRGSRLSPPAARRAAGTALVALGLALAAAVGVARAPGALASEDAAHAAQAPGGPSEGPGGHEGAAEGHGPRFVPQVVNFVLFFGGLFVLLRGPVGSYFKTRRADIEHALSAAERAQAEARKSIADVEARLEALGGEIAGMLSRVDAQAEAEGAAIVAKAEAEAVRIVAQAKAQAADLEGESVRRLRATAADLSLRLARELVEKGVRPEDRRRLFDRALKGIQKAAS